MTFAEDMNWVIATADPATQERLTRELSRVRSLSFTSDGFAALDMVRTKKCDVLAADLALPGLDAAALFERTSALGVNCLPWAVGLAHEGMGFMSARALQAGACRVLVMPTGRELLDACAQLNPFERLPRRGVTVPRIESMLWSLGFSANMRGTGYLAIAVKACCQDLTLTGRLTDAVYPLVAQAAGVTAQQAQHAIRRAIDAAWAGGPQDEQYRLFGNTIDAKRGKPTAGGMIARMAELLRTGLEISV